MRKIIDRTGQKSGRLTVLCEASRDTKGRVQWHCRCECGKEVTIRALSIGVTLSCGCLQREKAAIQGAASFRDRSGERVGRLLIKRVAGRRGNGRHAYECVCECGNQLTVSSGDLYAGRTTSCGCYQAEQSAKSNMERTKHGHSRSGGGNKRLTTPEYRTWKAMLERCRNENAPNYYLYGGRGITVCDRWTGPEGFANFFADMGTRLEGHTIDRKNNDGDYTPDNCRWASAKEQAMNRRETAPLKKARVKNLEKGRRHWPRKAAAVS